ncbi:hypothetical protein [Rhodanobacter sp. C05]|uniref:hypothetical protein n=1 Tax=Rhodanobacter sp. C05 TaxID=1945855 RepID=UPI0009CA1A39|nr:hypothetical protein [Rhodanobacter sp. C05]OOG37101.1 hypothetical protein B0E51_17535 [Rhodanobacter sp. C05]
MAASCLLPLAEPPAPVVPAEAPAEAMSAMTWALASLVSPSLDFPQGPLWVASGLREVAA